MNCYYCRKETREFFLGMPFLWTVREHWCGVCGQSKWLCRDHRTWTIQFDLQDSRYGQFYDLCPDCNQWRVDAANRVVAVKSDRVGSRRTINALGFVQTRHEHEDHDGAVWELKYNAAVRGCNAITNLNIIPHQHSSGNYIFKKWTAEGVFVTIE